MKTLVFLALLLAAVTAQAEEQDCPEVYWQAVVSIDCHFDLIGETDTSQTWKYVCDTTFETVQLICWQIPMPPMPESGIEVFVRDEKHRPLVVYDEHGRHPTPGFNREKKQILK